MRDFAGVSVRLVATTVSRKPYTGSFKLSGLLFGLLLAFFVFPERGSAQDEAGDRRQYTSGDSNTTDDPRRIPVPMGYREPDTNLVLTGGRVFDGTGTPTRAATLVIQANWITAVLPPDSTDWPEGADVIDLAGKTIMPGLIDMHTHMTYKEDGAHDSESDATLRAVERLRFFTESGITTIRDVSSEGIVPFRIKEWVSQDRLPLPRTFVAGALITGTGGHGATVSEGALELLGSAIRTASGPDDWREAVREQFDLGADLIKIASHFSEAEITAAVQEAHELGMLVTVDAETFYIERAVRAGADIIEHPLPRSELTIELMAKNNVASIPTIVTYNMIFDLAGGYWESSSRRFTFSKEANRKMLRDLKDAGIKIGVGTDLVVDWFRDLQTLYIAELEELVTAGYTVPEALIAATRTSAEILAMGDKLGTLEAGKLADLIVIDGKPDETLQDLANVDMVIRDGEIIVRDGRIYVPRHIPAGGKGWTMHTEEEK